MMKEDRITELFRGELMECQVIETLLSDNGIPCFLRNYAHTAYGPIVSPAQMVIVMVMEKDRDRASALLSDCSIYTK